MTTPADKAAFSLAELIEFALAQGIEQVRSVGSPLHPFLLDEGGNMTLLFDAAGGVDPMEMALPAIREKLPHAQRLALVIDSRLTFVDGKKWDAIVVMACERDADEGEVWGARYVPKGLLRKFRTEGEPEQVGRARNFIRVAFEDATPSEESNA